MRKNFFKLMFICFILLNIVTVYADTDFPNLHSENIGIYNAENMKLLYGKNQNEKISIASITKLMTAVVCVDNINSLDDVITVDYNVISGKVDPELSIAEIYDGEKLTYYDLIATMLVPSGADSAIYIANTVCGDYDTFISKMNEKAKEIGMENTSFSNPTGLDDDNNYSTISDVAKLLKYALQNDSLKEIMSMDKYTTSDGKLTVSGTIHRSAVRNGLDLNYIIGGKTGTTEDAGQCLASFCMDEETMLIGVVTGASMYSSAPNNIIDSEKLYNYISKSYSLKPVINEGDIVVNVNTVCCKQDNVNLYSTEKIEDYIDNFEKQKLNIIYNGKEEPDYRTKVGSVVGKADIYYDNVYLKSIDLKLNDKLNFSLKKWIILNKVGIICTVIILVIVTTTVLIVKRKKDK